MLKAVELSTGHRFTEPELDLITRGANELDIGNSGLEETMATAYHEILETRRRYPGMRNLRAAAFFNAFEKVGRTYIDLQMHCVVVNILQAMKQAHCRSHSLF